MARQEKVIRQHPRHGRVVLEDVAQGSKGEDMGHQNETRQQQMK
jgi:hypothetical protein